MSNDGKLRVLVIDDDKSLRSLLEAIIDISGVPHQADSVATTQEGLDLYERASLNGSYDVVLTDLNHQPTGLDVFKAIKGEGRDLNTQTEVYIMSGGGRDRELLKDTMEFAGDKFIQKPFPNAVIQRILQEAYAKKYAPRCAR